MIKRILAVMIVMTYLVSAMAAVTVTINGVSHTIPQRGEKGWGDNVTDWIQAVSSNTLQPTGGTFTLSDDVNFGPTYGLLGAYFSSRDASVAGAGLFRLATGDSIQWRNSADDGNLSLALSGDDLQFDGVDLLTDITGLSALTALEIDQLENIGSTTVSSGQWGYLGDLDQALTTGDAVSFAGVTSTSGATVSSGDVGVATGDLTVDAGDIEATLGDVTAGGVFSAGDGSNSAPAYTFTNETDSGFYSSDTDQISVALGGTQGAAFTRSASGFTNFGLGLYSTSDAIPFYLYRNSTSSVQVQVENPGTGAGSASGVTLKVGAANTGNILTYPTAMSLASLRDRIAIRSFVGDGVSLIANESTADTRFYVGGQTDADELMRFDDAGVVFDFNGTISPDSSLAFEVTGTTTQGSKPAPTLTQAQRDAVSSPADGAVVYNSDSSKYNYYNGASWAELGSGGNGEKNYLQNGDFESGVGLATAYEEGSADYADGDGGSPATISVSANTTTPLAGDQDLEITKAATDGSAEGVTLASQSIDRADQGRQLYFKGEFDFTDSNYTAGDICLKAYDVADSSILAVVPVSGLDEDGCFNKAKGRVLAKVLTTDSTTGVVRVSLHLESDSATGSAWSAYADDVVLGPQGTVPGAIVTPWESFTPTGSWTSNTTYSGIKRRVGDTLEMNVKIELSGAPNSTDLDIDVPDGLEIDTTKIDTSVENQSLGWVNILDSGASNLLGGLRYRNSTQLRPARTFVSGNEVRTASITDTTPITFTSGDALWIKAVVPIEGWKASAALSTTETLLQGAFVDVSSTGKTHSSSGSWVTLTLDTESKDTLNSFASNVFTAPTSGQFLFTAGVVFAANTTGQRGLRFYDVTNSTNLLPDSFGDTSSANEGVRQTTAILDLVEGQQIRVEGYQNSGGNLGYGASLQVKFLPDPSVFSVYGETDLVEDTTAMASYAPAVNNWGDLASIELTPGEWDISVIATTENLGAVASGVIFAGIGDIAGNTGPGSEGEDYVGATNVGNNTERSSLSFFKNGVVVTEPTTYYLKVFYSATTTNLQAAGKISARKVK